MSINPSASIPLKPMFNSTTCIRTSAAAKHFAPLSPSLLLSSKSRFIEVYPFSDSHMRSIPT